MSKPLDRPCGASPPNLTGLVSDHADTPIGDRSQAAPNVSRAAAVQPGGAVSAPRLRSPLAIVAAVFAVAVGGCGDAAGTRIAHGQPSSPTPDEQLATQRVAEFLAAMEANDDAYACAMLTPKLRRAITINLRMDSLAGTCRTRAADIYSPAKAPGNANATVTKIKVLGTGATATVTAEPTSDLASGPIESEVRLTRHGGRWLIANF